MFILYFIISYVEFFCVLRNFTLMDPLIILGIFQLINITTAVIYYLETRIKAKNDIENPEENHYI